MTANDRDAARGATESDADGSPSNVPPVSGARLAAYADVLRHHQFNLADVQVGRARCICGKALTESGGVDLALARHQSGALDAVADAELAGLKAEVERLKEAWQDEYGRARSAEAEVEREAESHARLAIQHREVKAERDDLVGRMNGSRCGDVAALVDSWVAAEAALTSEREAHAGLRARLEAEVEQAWESSSHWKARAERLQELRGTAEDRVSDLAEELSRFRADVEALAYDWDLYDEPCGETLRAILAAEPAAPVTAEEGGEQEAGDPRDAVIDAIEETFLPQLGSAALAHCAIEDVYAGMAALRERFQTAEWKDGERR